MMPIGLSAQNQSGGIMTAPLDPAIAEVIPKLPLRDPPTMTPKSARDSLRALADARAAIPPPPVASVADITVKGAAGPLNARVYRNGQGKSPTVVFFHGGGWVAGDLETHDRQAPRSSSSLKSARTRWASCFAAGAASPSPK
jgi:acetyl esterase